MAPIEIRFTFDYVDPGSYLACRLLERWEAGIDRPVEVVWRPLELRPPPAPPLDPRSAEWSQRHRDMAGHAAREGVTFHPPARIPWTRKAHELALHAKEGSCFSPIHRALFEAHFVEARDIGRVDVLTQIAEAHGLDGSEVRAVLGVDRFREAVLSARKDALRAGVVGVPTLEAGDSRLQGFRSPSALAEFLSDLQR